MDFILFCVIYNPIPYRMLTVKFYCIDIKRKQHPLMPLVATNTNQVPFHIMCWYLKVFTSENLQVFHRDHSCFQQPLDEILSRIDFLKNTVFCRALVAGQCDMRFLEIDQKTKILNVVVHYFFTEYIFAITK